MSHEATNWAIKQRGLKPTTKIVLWHLCDRFNPDYGCFPSQDRLAHDCEISRSTLNDHIGQLQAAGLPVNDPRSWPNSSLSSKVSGMAAQLMAMNGAAARSLY